MVVFEKTVMDRRAFLSLLVAAATLPHFAFADAGEAMPVTDDAGWASWKSAFLMADGRVVDHLQQDASHTEGQGYGLVLSVYHGDRAAFEAIRGWTFANLAERSDGLLNWKRVPGAATAEAANATDGDIFVAWGLMLGADRFDIPEARAQASRIATAISGLCLVADPRDPARLILLPAAEGFLHGTKAIINPSYIMPRALYDLAGLIGDPRLAQAASDGLDLLDDLAAASALPDWVEIDIAGARPSTEQAAQFGYDALRVALYLVWSGRLDHAAVRKAAEVYGQAAAKATPVVLDLEQGGVQESSSYPGFAALHDLVDGRKTKVGGLDVAQGYYPATIEMLCRLAADDTAPAM